MSRYTTDQLDRGAVGLRLIRHDSKGRAHFCEPVFFVNGRDGVDTVLRRAQIAGRVEADGDVIDQGTEGGRR